MSENTRQSPDPAADSADKAVLTTIALGLSVAAASAQAHTVKVNYRVEPNSDVTFFAATYHGGSSNLGALSLTE